MMMLSLYEKNVLDSIRGRMVDMSEDGVNCPCCAKLFKQYRRKLHTEMALWLIGLYRLHKETNGWYTTLDILKVSPHLKAGGTNGTLLIHWGLIEKIPTDNKAEAPAGSYRPTDKGILFARNLTSVEKFVHLLDNKFVGFSGSHVSIVECLGNDFNYPELMG